MVLAKSMNLNMGMDFSAFVEKLNYESFLLMQNPKTYKLTYNFN